MHKKEASQCSSIQSLGITTVATSLDLYFLVQKAMRRGANLIHAAIQPHAVYHRCVHTFRDHPMRQQVLSVAHSRPFDRAAIPSIVSTFTLTHKMPVMYDGVQCPLSIDGPRPASQHTDSPHEVWFAHLKQLCDHFMVAPPPANASFFTAELAGTCKLRWERHIEAQTFTFSREATPDDMTSPFHAQAVPLSVIPEWWTRTVPGTIVAATHIALLDHASAPRFEWITNQFGRSSMITAAAVDSDRFRVYSDWRAHSDGFGRMLLLSDMPDHAANKRSSAGKVLQRLIEVEKYRVLALMGLPFAQALVPRIDLLDSQLQNVMGSVGHAGQLDVVEQRQLLDQLSELTAASLKLSTSSHFRFSASAAYSQIVDDRIRFLGMQSIDGVPSMATFIQGTLHPALRTCDTVVSRLKALSSSSQIAGDLLRTSLNVQQQADSHRQLEQIQNNARSQLLLQESVEGLSVVAITYYSTGVLGYVARAADKLGMLPVPPEMALGMSLPLIAIGVYAGLNRLKRHVHGG